MDDDLLLGLIPSQQQLEREALGLQPGLLGRWQERRDERTAAGLPQAGSLMDAIRSFGQTFPSAAKAAEAASAEDVAAAVTDGIIDAAPVVPELSFFQRHTTGVVLGVGALALIGIGVGIYYAVK